MKHICVTLHREMLLTLCRRQCQGNREFFDRLYAIIAVLTENSIEFSSCRDRYDCCDLGGLTVDRQVSVATTTQIFTATPKKTACPNCVGITIAPPHLLSIRPRGSLSQLLICQPTQHYRPNFVP